MKLHNALKKYLVLILFFVAYTYNLQATPFLEQQWITTTNYSWNTGNNCRDMDFYNNKLYVIDKGNTQIHVINASTGAEITGEVISSTYFTGFCICIDGNGNKLVTENAYGMTNSFKASKMVGITVTYLGDTPSTTGGRIDYLDMYGNFNNGSGYIVGATTNTSDQISVWTFSNGTISNIASPIAFTNLRGNAYINSDICIVDNSSFWVSGAGIKPILVTMNPDKSYSGKTTLNLPSNPPSGGIAYFELRSKKYVVVPTNTDGTVTVYNVDNMNAPVEIASTVSLNVSDLTHTPIEVVTGEDNALIYIWGVNRGAAAYKFCLPPTVTANDADNITTTTATLNASFVKGTKTITARGFRYGTSSGNYPSSCSGTVSGTNFSADITGLTANTTYYYQAYVTTADGTVYSNEKSFTTSPIPPTVTTNDATNIQTTTATLNASYAQGSKPITARGFNYGTTSGSYTEHISGTVSGINFSANITGLTAYTTYYYKAYVTTADGTVNATELSFTTLASDSVILSDESKTIPDNFEGNIIMYHGGQVANPSSFNFTGQIRYKRTFSTPTQWHTVCFPFDIDHVTVTEDNTEYTIKPYYSGAAANSCHFWIKTLNRDPSNPELYQRWRTPSGHTIRKDTAYIIIFPDASYYADKEITFYSTTGSHTINNDTMSVATYEVTGDGLYFYSNLSLRKQTFTGTEFFRLDRTPYTGNFELHTNPVILPNECFIQASDSYKQSSPSILMNFSPEEETVYTGVPPTIFSIPLTITSHDNTICLMSEANQTIEIYSVSGIKIATYTMKNGEVRTLKLPKSVYVIRSNQNDKPLKIIL